VMCCPFREPLGIVNFSPAEDPLFEFRKKACSS
jgi:hypothetical protein